MSDLKFTDDEAQLVNAMANTRHGVASRLGFYASVLFPVFVFGAYGIVSQDFLATAVSLVGLSIFVGWNLSQESKYVGLYKSVFEKVAQHQRDSTPPVQQAAAREVGCPPEQ
jgi:hypothetical protein